MASNALPPLPARQVAVLPQLPPRSNPPSSHSPEAPDASQIALPPLPSRPSQNASESHYASPHGSNSAASLVSSSNHSGSVPPLPQRHDLEADSRAPSKAPSPTHPTASHDSTPSSQFKGQAVPAHGTSASDRSHIQAPQPALPARTAPSSQPASNLAIPPLPARSSQSLSPPPASSSSTSGLPQLPSRRTQSHAPPVQVSHGPPPVLPPSVGVNDNKSPNHAAAPTLSHTGAGNPPTLPPSQMQPPVLPQSLPNQQHIPQQNSNFHAQGPPPALPPLSNVAPSNFHTVATPSHAPMLPAHSQHIAHPTSVAHGPPPALPPSVSPLPALPKRSADSLSPTPQTSTNSYNNSPRSASVSVASRTAPPPINRSSQPSPSPGAHSTQVVGSSSSGGMYLGSLQNRSNDTSPSSRASVAKAPMLPASTTPPRLPPSLPPSNAGTTPIRERSSTYSQSPALPPSLPPSLPASSSTAEPPKLPPSRLYAEPKIVAPQVVVVPGSPATRQRSKSFDAGPPPPLPVSRSATPEPSKSGKNKSQLLVPGSSAEAPPATSSKESKENKDKHKGGRKRANSASSDDGFAAIVRDLTNDQVAEGKYSVMVLSPQKQAKILGESDYVMMYPIEVRKGTQNWTVFRRYKQFYALDSDFKRLHLYKKCSFSSPIPPKNASASKKDPLLLEARRRGFQKYLSDICDTPLLADSDTFYMFIQPFQIGDTKPK